MEKLVSGTEEHYYYLCLLSEQLGRPQQLEDLIRNYDLQHTGLPTQNMRREELRRKFIEYPASDPSSQEDVLRWLQDSLNISFNDSPMPTLSASTSDSVLVPSTLDLSCLRFDRLLDACTTSSGIGVIKRENNAQHHPLVLQKLNASDGRQILHYLNNYGVPRGLDIKSLLKKVTEAPNLKLLLCCSN